MGSRGSVIPFFRSITSGIFPITDLRMTRFMITLPQAVDLVWNAFEDMRGGEIYVKKIPSMRVVDVAKTLNPKAVLEVVGIRPGEKLHEQMIGSEDAPHTYEYDNFFKILPAIHGWNEDPKRIGRGIKVPDNFIYSSDTNSEWMSSAELMGWVDLSNDEIGKI